MCIKLSYPCLEYSSSLFAVVSFIDYTRDKKDGMGRLTAALK